MLRLDDLKIYVQTADAGSFSEAARQLELTSSFASAAVQRLERELGTRLFVRTTRSLRLSDDGERYLPYAHAALRALDSGNQVLADTQSDIAGSLRLSVPSDFGRNILLPWLDEFQAIHPRLTLHLRISDRAADLVRQPLDAAIRYGTLDDSSLVALPLVPDNRRVLCAAPSYLKGHPTINRPEDLSAHNCLRFFWGEQTFERWRFLTPDGVKNVSVSGDRLSDDAELARRWAVAGQGLVYKSRLDVLPDLLAGRLVEVFPAEYGELAPLNLVCAHRTSLTPAVQVLRDFVKQRCDTLMVHKK